MSFERIAGLLFSGFMTKLYAVAGALWIAYEATTFIRHAFASMGKGLL